MPIFAGRRARDAADKRFVAAAKTKADIAQLSLTQLRYAAAAQDFHEAGPLWPVPRSNLTHDNVYHAWNLGLSRARHLVHTFDLA
jgi:hypothetical protein